MNIYSLVLALLFINVILAIFIVHVLHEQHEQHEHHETSEAKAKVEHYTTVERVTFFLKDTITVNSNDPYFQYAARQKLIDNFSIKTRVEIHVCLSDECTDTFIVNASKGANTNGILTEQSTFMFVRNAELAYDKSVVTKEKEDASLTEYYGNNAFATIGFQVTVTADIPLDQKMTLSTLKDYIRNGTCKVWFDETKHVRDNFIIEKGMSATSSIPMSSLPISSVLTASATSPLPFEFVSWSTNMVVPEIQCGPGECDTFRIVPR